MMQKRGQTIGRRGGRPAATAVLLTVLTGGAPALRAQAQPLPPNEISLRGGATFVGKGEQAALSQHDRLGQAELSFGRRLLQLGRAELWGELGAVAGGQANELFGDTLRTELALLSLTAGARVSWPIVSWLVAQGRIGVGPAWGRVELESQGGSVGTRTSADDWAAGVTTHALAGLQALWRLPGVQRGAASRAPLVGLLLEGGYSLSSDLRFTATLPPRDDASLQLPRAGVSLGSINLSGATLRLGATLRF